MTFLETIANNFRDAKSLRAFVVLFPGVHLSMKLLPIVGGASSKDREIMILINPRLISANYLLFLDEKIYEVVFNPFRKCKYFEVPMLNGLFEGHWIQFYSNGEVRQKGKYTHGKKNGLFSDFNENGDLEREIEYSNGEKNGKITLWNKNGIKFLEDLYKDGKREGLSTFWYGDGVKMSEGNFKNDRYDGMWTTWHENKEVKEQGRYENGSKVGIWTSWHDNREKSS